MDAFKILIFSLLLFLKTIDDVNSECSVSVNNDFSIPSPVFIREDAFLSPDTSGAITFKRSETVTVGCPGNGNRVVLGNATTSYNVLIAHCINNQTFRVDRWIGPFKNIKCHKEPYIITVDSGRKCYEGARIHGVGYNVSTKFHQLYEACFNGDVLRTHYVTHQLSPVNNFIQGGREGLNFIEGTLFGKVRMSSAYKTNKQISQLNSILGANMSEHYINKTGNVFLSRGHLAPRADFTLRAEVRASFHYVNAAPQWQRVNAGVWQALENALRRRVQSLGRPVTVVTGVYGAMQLNDSRGVPQTIHLVTDDNNNPLVTVPLYFYKLIYDPKTETAIVFVSINSPFLNKNDKSKLSFCEDVCQDGEVSWLQWQGSTVQSFCCTYEEFTDQVPHLRGMAVKGLFV